MIIISQRAFKQQMILKINLKNILIIVGLMSVCQMLLDSQFMLILIKILFMLKENITPRKKVYEREEKDKDEAINNHTLNDARVIFYMKNKCGYKDKIEAENTTQGKVTIVNSLPKDDEDESNN